ncbi:nucleosidase [Cumulibacter manganitolerans]|uniref:nucleosidase n=1 Tax=Cumulibacter manganitolerans TaxID=1884992 RepID=UPI001297ED86|nr:nucleosidase [Cumulibacter manganitolerans]
MPASDLIVVSATRAEAKYVPPGLRLLICGIGKTDAAIAVTRAVLEVGPTARVINIGTAGALRPDVSGLYLPSVVRMHDVSAAALRSMGYDIVDEVAIEDGDGSTLATGDSFISDAVVRDILAREAHMVDMEGFAIARACAQLGVPVRLVKHISDQADESAMNWPQLVDRSARALGDWLRDNVG